MYVHNSVCIYVYMYLYVCIYVCTWVIISSYINRYNEVISQIADDYYPDNLLLVTHQYGVEEALTFPPDKKNSTYYEVLILYMWYTCDINVILILYTWLTCDLWYTTIYKWLDINMFL